MLFRSEQEFGRREEELRKLLSHLLGLKTPFGHPLICAETLFQQLLEDYEARQGWSASMRSLTPTHLFQFLERDTSVTGISNDRMLFCMLHDHYRHLVCGLSKPDWLCGRAGPPELLHPDFPVHVTDRDGGREYIFSIRPIKNEVPTKAPFPPRSRR